MNTWTRLIGSLGICLASFNAQATSAFIDESGKSYLVFSSDPQYPWTPESDAGRDISNRENEKRSKELIHEQYLNIAEFRQSRPEQNVPVMINGDMTAFGHGWQREFVYRILDHHLNGDYYFGLGNHDYENNVGDCAANGCARESLFDLKTRMGDKVDAMDVSIERVGRNETWIGSLAYSKRIEDVQLIQLNNYPTYRVDFTSLKLTQFRDYDFRIRASLDWLEDELKKARAANRIIILNMHKPDEWIASTEERDRFKAMIQQYEVSAVFAGHHHSRSGPYDRNSFFGTVPLFLSGSASQRHYLIAEVDRNAGRLNVMLVGQNDWQSGVVLARPRLPASEQVQ